MDAPIVARGFLAACLLLPALASADLTLRRSIQSPNAIDGDGFGTQVAPVGQRGDLLVTAPGDGDTPPEVGGAYLLDVATGDLLQHLTSPAPMTGSGFGLSAGAFGGFEGTLGAELVIGAPFDDATAGTAAGVVRRYDAATGSLLDTLEGPSAGATLGVALAPMTPWMAPSDLLLTAPGDGVAYRIDGTTGLVTATFIDPTGVAGFGTAVADDGAVVALGSPADGPGKVHLFNATTGTLVDTVTNPTGTATGFGRAIVFGGGDLYVGAPQASGGGAVYVFDSVGTLVTTLTNPASTASAGFGAALRYENHLLFVGAPTSGTEAGRVYLIDTTTGLVTETMTNPEPAVVGFGSALALLGGWTPPSIAIGAPGDAGEPGAVHVFSVCGDAVGAPGEACDDGNTTDGDCCSASCGLESTGTICAGGACDGPFTLRRVLSSPNPTNGDNFGWRVGASAGGVLATSPLDSTAAAGAGAAYRFDAATGVLAQSFFSPTPDIAEALGFSFASLGSQVFLPAPLDTDAGVPNAGLVYVFDALSGALLDTWSRPGGGAASVSFGMALAAGDTAVAVGAYENPDAYVFEPLTGTLVTTLTDPDGGIGRFGSAVAINDGIVFVGAPDNGLGKVVAFDAVSGAVLRTLTPPDPDVLLFGSTLATHGEALLVSAPAGTGPGVVYVYDGDTGTLLQTITNPNPCETRGFGIAMASVEDGVLIGAPELAPGGVAGAAYLFEDTTWTLAQSFAPEGPAMFGAGVGALGGSLLVGASGDETTSGEAYLYSACGNAVVDPGEVCDDGNDEDGDACSEGCSVTTSTTTTTSTSLPGGSTTTTLPPDPSTIAPPIDRTVATDLFVATEFLYAGPEPIQTGVEADVIDPLRVAVVRGEVTDRSGATLGGVTVQVVNHGEFGQTLTRADGRFDLVVNGGGLLTLRFAKPGYLPADRQVDPLWNDQIALKPIALVPLSDVGTEVDLTSSEVQIVNGTLSADGDGDRTARLLFLPGTEASLVLKNHGGTTPITTLTVRTTEYTVGPNGPAAMPADLPANIAYTYAIELSADEVEAADAAAVAFSQPVVFYVDNFLQFPVGGQVPAGYYDRERTVWVPSNNGRIVTVVGVTDDRADLDVNGDEISDHEDESEYAALGISVLERDAMATLYDPGAQLWRVPIPHFTPWDMNWGVPVDADGPNQPAAEGDKTPENCEKSNNSVIGIQSQCLGEDAAITGTSFSLHYKSDRVLGRSASRTLRIPVTGASVPGSLTRVDLDIQIGGRRFLVPLPATENQVYEFTWDQKDAYGRLLQGAQPYSYTIGYVYPGLSYQSPGEFLQSFGRATGFSLTQNPTRSEATVSQQHRGVMRLWDAPAEGLGGWSLSVHHAYDPTGRVLYLGDGRRKTADDITYVQGAVAGNGTGCGGAPYSGENGPALAAKLPGVRNMASAPDGSLFVAHGNYDCDHGVRRVGTDGLMKTFIGYGGGSASGAFTAQDPKGIAVDGEGRVYVTSGGYFHSNRVVRLDSNGENFTVLVSQSGECGFAGDGGPAEVAQLCDPSDIVVAPDGNIYIADSGNARIRRVDTTGTITTIAGNGNPAFYGEGIAAIDAQLNPTSLALGYDGSLYVSDTENARVRRIWPNGLITTVAGNGVTEYNGDGFPAVDAQLSPGGLAYARDGSLYVSEGQRLRKIGPDGTITTIAGTGEFVETYEPGAGIGYPATGAPLAMSEVSIGPDGTIHLADRPGVRSVVPAYPGRTTAPEIVIPSEDLAELFVFDERGRHLRTIDAHTNSQRFEFSYDDAGRLTNVIDADGRPLTIERDVSDGRPTGILSAANDRTTLTVTDGLLAAVSNPASETAQFQYADGGLLEQITDARSEVYSYAYDTLGRLRRTDDPSGGSRVLTPSRTANSYSVAVATAEGRVSTFEVATTSDGDESRTNTWPGGATSGAAIGQSGSRTLASPSGVLATRVDTPDPRFGMTASLQSWTAATPGGLVSVVGMTRQSSSLPPGQLLPNQTRETFSTNGLETTIDIDRDARTMTTTSPMGRSRIRTLDSAGRLASSQFPGLAPVSLERDSLGRLRAISHGTAPGVRTTTMEYDDHDRVVSVTNPLGQVTTFTYDDAGRLETQTAPDERTFTFAYDPKGNITSISPPGRPAHQLSYTPVGLEEEYTPPTLGAPLSTSYLYNADRQITTIARPGGDVVSVAYDPTTGRPASVTTSVETVSASYEATGGRLLELETSTGTGLAYTYDGPLLTSVTWGGAVVGSVSYSYDEFFRVTATSVGGSFALAHSYDDDGLLVGTGALELRRHEGNGLVVGSTIENVSDSFAYNEFGEIERYAATVGGVEKCALEYVRDDLGRVSEVTEAVLGTTTIKEYSYDAAGRLEEVTTNGTSTTTYTYDDNGNRVGRLGPLGDLATGIYNDRDQLLSYGDWEYGYAEDGDLASKTRDGATTTFSYDAFGNLRGVALSDGTLIDYAIDPQNRRIGKFVNGELVQGFIYLDQLRLAAEIDDAGNIVARYAYGVRRNVPEYMERGGTTYRLVTDPLGSPRLVVNVSDGAIVQRMEFDEFGRLLQRDCPSLPSEACAKLHPFGFGGGMYDPDTGLVRFGARDYDPEVGRFTTTDQMRIRALEPNLYTYAGNDAVNYSDPNGMFPFNMAFPPFGPLWDGTWNRGRNVHNWCPRVKPRKGPDGKACDWTGRKWDQDEGMYNQFHGAKLGYETFRAPIEDFSGFPLAGSQCTYDTNGELVDTGPYLGTFDYYRPGTVVEWSFWMHGLHDVVPGSLVGAEPNLTHQY